MSSARRLWTVALAAVLVASAALSQASDRNGPVPPGSMKLKPVPTDGIGVPFCSSDLSTTPCPMRNPGLPGHGCDNSLGLGGAALFARGTASVSADDLRLFVHGMPPKATAVFLQGEMGIDDGRPFGDGLMCLGGKIQKIAVLKTGDGNAVLPPNGSKYSISDLERMPVRGGIRYYQVVYRDPGAFQLPGSRPTLNTTNAWMQVWMP